MHSRYRAATIAAVLIAGAAACAEPERVETLDATGPAVAVVPRDGAEASVTPIDAAPEAMADPTPDAAADSPASPDVIAHDTSVDRAEDAVVPRDSAVSDSAPDAVLPPDTRDTPAEPPPTVTRIPEANAPARRPAGTKVSCLAGPSTLDHTDCPVLQWHGYSYWAFSYEDNRAAIDIVAYDATGRIVKEITRENVRYIWNIEVDAARREVVFGFQGNRMVAIGWDELRVTAP